MAEVYILSSVDSTTPVELTGGRVGSFKIKSSSEDLRVGDVSVTSSTGFVLLFSSVHEFYVTSPDEIYLVSEGITTNVTVYHNR
jgi:hypothetical protein